MTSSFELMEIPKPYHTFLLEIQTNTTVYMLVFLKGAVIVADN